MTQLSPRRKFIKPYLACVTLLVGAGVFGCYRAANLRAETTMPVYTTSDEAAKAFMVFISEINNHFADEDLTRVEITNIISHENIKKLQGNDAQNIASMMRILFLQPTWKTESRESTDGKSANVKVTLSMFSPHDVTCVHEDTGWRVDLIATYAAWKELSGPEAEKIFLSSRDSARRASCQSNLKQISLGMMQYCQDYDEKYPPAKEWIDATMPYIKSEQVFNCPSLPADGKYGYAMNWKLSRVSMEKVESSASMVALYESTELKRNHNGDGKDIAYRHLDGTNMAFADGHVKWYQKNDAGKWPYAHFTFKP